MTPHFHSLVPDGAFVPGEGGVRSESLPPPTQGEVERLPRVVRHWVPRLLEKTSKPSRPASHEGDAGVPESIRQWIAEEIARAVSELFGLWAVQEIFCDGGCAERLKESICLVKGTAVDAC